MYSGYYNDPGLFHSDTVAKLLSDTDRVRNRLVYRNRTRTEEKRRGVEGDLVSPLACFVLCAMRGEGWG